MDLKIKSEDWQIGKHMKRYDRQQVCVLNKFLDLLQGETVVVGTEFPSKVVVVQSAKFTVNFKTVGCLTDVS
jgi:hypothetical protein